MLQKIKYIKHIKICGFFLLLGLMFVLNNRLEKVDVDSNNKTESVVNVETNNSGIAPLSAQVPDNSEGTLPLKLISNPTSNFLVFVNHSFEYKNTLRFIQIKKRYLNYCTRFQAFFLTEFMVTARNKDIR